MLSACVGTDRRSGVMAPKRRAAASRKAGGKKVKVEPEEETPKPQDAFRAAKEALKAAGPEVKGSRKVDERCGIPSAEVSDLNHE